MAAERRSRSAAGTGRRFAWYGRLSTKDKQDPTLSFPSQREACAEKAEELSGEIVCEFTDQEAGRRDDRAGWADLLREAKERDARRFDAVIVYATSRLSRDLFHALTYEREMTRAAVEVFYALTAGDQTNPEGRLVRHMFQALDQFEVEKLGREVRRGQDEWVEADERHEALISDEQFERAQTEMQRRSGGQGGNQRRRPQKRPYLLRGIVHCATGHNPLRMQGRSRRGEPTTTPAATGLPTATGPPRRWATASGSTCARTASRR